MESLKTHLLAFGLPGLVAIAFLDSAGIPLPGGVDVVIMLLSWQRPALFVPIALLAAAGSAAGCFVLYRVARTGGDALLSRFPERKRDWVKDKVRRNDVVAITLAMLGPPPFPTKLFILVAGIVGMDWKRFLGAVFAGRLVRFVGEAYLAVRLGDRAAGTLREHYPAVAIALAAVAVTYVLGRHLLARRAEARG